MTRLTIKLVGLAREFSQQNNLSIYELLQKINYHKVSDKISENDLYNELLRNPSYADDWLEYSQGKRCFGWYFKEDEDGKYQIGHFDGSRCSEVNYEDKLEACAIFLKKELDVIVQ